MHQYAYNINFEIHQELKSGAITIAIISIKVIEMATISENVFVTVTIKLRELSFLLFSVKRFIIFLNRLVIYALQTLLETFYFIAQQL